MARFKFKRPQWSLPSWPTFNLELPSKWRSFFLSTLLIMVFAWIALPAQLSLPARDLVSQLPNSLSLPTDQVPAKITLSKLPLDLRPYGVPVSSDLELKRGLDIQGGTQITLEADMSNIPESERAEALASTQEVLRRRVDLFGINEPQIRTVVFENNYRIMVELPGLSQPEAALQLIGQTAQLQFKVPPSEDNPEATASAIAYLQAFQPTELTGDRLERAQIQFDPNTNQPVVSLQFDNQGADLFGKLTEENVGQPLGIFLDNQPLTMPVVNEPIYGGQAVIQGQFTVDQAETLAAQLQAGALPVSIQIVEQNTIGPTLGAASLQSSVQAGVLGLLLVAIFMIMLYGWLGFIAVVGLIAYGFITVALYKMIPVTLTLPGITGLLLSIGMAVDANILSFERIKEELRSGKTVAQAKKLGYQRSWDSIKDANLATLAISFILFNPLNWSFLSTSGPIRGFAVTLSLGIFISLFTGVYYSQLLVQIFWHPRKEEEQA